MATAPQANMPLFYKELAPLNSRKHGAWRSRTTDRATWLANQHVVPLTVEEFAQAQRHYPIIFSAGDDPVPLALMGMNEGVNVFVDGEGALTEAVYIPAYARRYPFALARLSPEASALSLCVDPTTDLVGQFADGAPLFEAEEPSASCKATLDFCERFEIAGQKTTSFMAELAKHDLLMDGEASIRQPGTDKPFVYRGFRMVNEEKLRDARGDVLREWNRNGVLTLITAHLFSLGLMSDIFNRQHRLTEEPVQS
jgi:hypothetical protein